jgi:Metal-dependent amidase/aminoacylase/carboxypeptidase
MMQRKIMDLAERYLEEVTNLRRELHKIPELAGNEIRTSAFLRERLKLLPLQLHAPYLHTDVVGLISGNAPGRNVTLRADMDALR